MKVPRKLDDDQGVQKVPIDHVGCPVDLSQNPAPEIKDAQVSENDHPPHGYDGT